MSDKWQLVFDEETYGKVLERALAEAEEFFWLVSADIKDVHVVRGRRSVPLVGEWADLVERGVHVRVIHAKDPGPRFR